MLGVVQGHSPATAATAAGPVFTVRALGLFACSLSLASAGGSLKLWPVQALMRMPLSAHAAPVRGRAALPFSAGSAFWWTMPSHAPVLQVWTAHAALQGLTAPAQAVPLLAPTPAAAVRVSFVLHPFLLLAVLEGRCARCAAGPQPSGDGCGCLYSMQCTRRPLDLLPRLRHAR